MNLQFEAPFAEDPTAGDLSANAPIIQSPPDTVTLQSVNVQNRVSPNDQIPITVEIGNDTCVLANIGHPDYCTELLSSGWNLGVGATLGASQDTNGKCHGCGSRQNYELLVTAPSAPGGYDLVIQVYGNNTGDMIETDTIPITVESDAPENPYTPPDNGGGGGGGGQDPSAPSEGPLEAVLGDILPDTSGAVAPLVILVVILVALLYLTAI